MLVFYFSHSLGLEEKGDFRHRTSLFWLKIGTSSCIDFCLYTGCLVNKVYTVSNKILIINFETYDSIDEKRYCLRPFFLQDKITRSITLYKYMKSLVKTGFAE